MQERCSSIANALELRLSCTTHRNNKPLPGIAVTIGHCMLCVLLTYIGHIGAWIGNNTLWRHLMQLFMRGIHRSTVDSHQKGHWHGDLMFCALNGWGNDSDASDLRRHSAHYDVTVTILHAWFYCSSICKVNFVSAQPRLEFKHGWVI